MESKERYGRFVLQFEDARTSAGSFFRAVQVGSGGYEKHVHLFRSELLAPEVAQTVAVGLKTGLQVQHAQVVRGFDAGRIDKTAYAAYEMFEGRSVGALMERSQAEGHPFAADHALLIASKAAAALEAAQTRKQCHGFLVPEFIHVSHDGEVSVRGFGLPPRVLRSANCIGVREARFLAPELDGTAPLDVRADVFSLGAQLFEMLTGSALSRQEAALQSIEAARIPSPGTDGTPIPKALATLLGQALAEDPGRRFKDATTFKKAVDTLLFSGDYSPTTFNLAFFMHTLFRDEGDDDALRIKAEKTEDYRAYLPAAVPAPAPAPAPSPSGLTHAPAPPKAQESTVFKAESAKFEPMRTDSGRTPRPAGLPHPPAHAHPQAHATTPAPAPIPAGAADHLFETVMAEKKPFPVVPVVIGVVAVLVAGYLLTRQGTATPGPAAAPTMNAAEAAALARVKELESRLAALESEKAAAEQKAADEAKTSIEAQAKARGRAVDPAELQRAQDEARRKAQLDQEARLQAERQKIEEERKFAEERRAAEALKAAEAARALEAAATPIPAPVSTPVVAVVAPTAAPAPVLSTPAAAPAPAAPTSAAPSTGGLLDLTDPAVVPPALVSQSRIEYPAIAKAQRITGSVMISALVDEQGNVVESRVIRGAPPNSGLNQAALENVKRRKYKPATLNGKPGRAWIAIQIDFKL